MRSVYRLSVLTFVSSTFIVSAFGADSSGTLLERHQCRFDVILGRIVFQSGSPAKGQHHGGGTGAEETLSVTSQIRGPSLHYVRRTPDQTVILDVFDGNRVQLECRSSSKAGTPVVLTYRQPVAGRIRVHFTQARREQEFEAESLWHLCAAEPVFFQAHLLPLFQRLRIAPQQGWDIDAVHAESLQMLQKTPAPKEDAFRTLVVQLGHPSRSERNDAQARLQAGGLATLTLIDQIDPNVLDAEQHARLEQVRFNLLPVRSDRPQRIAAWLSTDHRYWQVAAQRLARTERLAVDQRLKRTTGRGLPSHLLDVPIRVAEGHAVTRSR